MLRPYKSAVVYLIENCCNLVTFLKNTVKARVLIFHQIISFNSKIFLL